MQDSVLERWLAFLHTGLSPVEPSELILAHSWWFFSAVPYRARNSAWLDTARLGTGDAHLAFEKR
jgi:hypothetical protein